MPVPRDSWVPTTVLAVLLVSASALLIRAHSRTWQRRRQDESLDQGDLLHFQGQHRRRTQASGLLGIIGILLVIGDLLIPWHKAPILFSVYWMLILALTGYLILLAAADAISTAAYTRAAIARIRAQRRHLEREAAELREKRQTPELPVD